MVEASVERLRRVGPGSRARWQPGEEAAAETASSALLERLPLFAADQAPEEFPVSFAKTRLARTPPAATLLRLLLGGAHWYGDKAFSGPMAALPIDDRTAQRSYHPVDPLDSRVDDRSQIVQTSGFDNRDGIIRTAQALAGQDPRDGERLLNDVARPLPISLDEHIAPNGHTVLPRAPLTDPGRAP